MERFMIGQFGKFDEEKQKRDFKECFFGVEAICFKSEDEVRKLKREAGARKFEIGVHFPLRADIWKHRDAQFMSLNDEIKRESYQYAEKEFNFIKTVNPDYVLFHYPKPVIIDEKEDWTKWRFGDRTEYCFEKDYPFDKFKSESEELFAWLDENIADEGITPILELDAVNKYIYDSNILQELLERYPRIKLCLDLGRISLQEKLQKRFNSFDLVKKFAKYAYVIHLWNIKICDTVENNHYPALPELKPEDGWGDIERYFEIICEENDSFKVQFEHRSDLISDEELQRCYKWVSNMIDKNTVG